MLFKGGLMRAPWSIQAATTAPNGAEFVTGFCEKLNIEISLDVSRHAVMPDLEHREITNPI